MASVRLTAAVTTLLFLIVGGLAGPERAWAPTAVEYLVGPVGLVKGQTAQLQCQNNFAPRGAQIRLTAVDPSDPSGILAGGKVVSVPFRAVASLELNVDQAFPDLQPGSRLGLLGVIEIITAPGPGLMEEEGLLPGTSLQVFDNATGRTELVVIAIRNRTRLAAP